MKTKQILSVLKIISWVLFISLCIQAGSIIFSVIYSSFDPATAQNVYLGLNLSNLYQANIGHYLLVVSCLIILPILKAYIFYLVVTVFRTVNLESLFEIKLASLIARISNVAFLIWITLIISSTHTGWLTNNGIEISEIYTRSHNSGGSEFFFLGMILVVISQIFKRGIEIQSENSLTI